MIFYTQFFCCSLFSSFSYDVTMESNKVKLWYIIYSLSSYSVTVASSEISGGEGRKNSPHLPVLKRSQTKIQPKIRKKGDSPINHRKNVNKWFWKEDPVRAMMLKKDLVITKLRTSKIKKTSTNPNKNSARKIDKNRTWTPNERENPKEREIQSCSTIECFRVSSIADNSISDCSEKQLHATPRVKLNNQNSKGPAAAKYSSIN